MDRAEIAALIETRANSNETAAVFKSERHHVRLGDGISGDLRIEYRPDDLVLAQGAFLSLVDADFFERGGKAEDYSEAIVSELYLSLVDLIFPGSSYLDNPQDRLPLLVELEYEDPTGHSTWVTTMGSLAGV